MKIRNGFVSNSSSSSFVCNVCGNVESGMDASASDLGMTECVNGHIFCDGHGDGLPEPKPEEIREIITRLIEKRTWLSEEHKKSQLNELEETPDDELQEYYRNEFDSNVMPCQCPICSFKELATEDVYLYLTKKLNMSYEFLRNEIKDTFKNYSAFEQYIRPGPSGK